MSILTPDELTPIRRAVAEETDSSIDWSKTQINAAVQAVENFAEARIPQISAAIDAATVPFGYTFSGPRKIAIIKYWLKSKYDRGV